jgi:hypothetical protein
MPSLCIFADQNCAAGLQKPNQPARFNSIDAFRSLLDPARYSAVNTQEAVMARQGMDIGSAVGLQATALGAGLGAMLYTGHAQAMERVRQDREARPLRGSLGQGARRVR